MFTHREIIHINRSVQKIIPLEIAPITEENEVDALKTLDTAG